MNTAPRLDKLGRSFDTRFMLCLRHEDIRWLSGFSGSTSQLLVDRQNREGHLFVDGRYVNRAHTEVARAGASVTVHLLQSGTTIDDLLSDIVNGEPIEVDDTHLTAAHFSRLQSRFVVRVAASPLDDLRRVKDDQEIALISRAADIADLAFAELLEDGLIGRTERDIRNRLEALMRERGADAVAFDTIVATGMNGAVPHHEPTDAVVEDGHMVVIDFGAQVQGYRSDMTRTVRVGNVSAELLSMFAIVLEAQEAGLASVKAGVVGASVDQAVRVVYAREGVEHEYVHGTGHGIGLFIHEPPIFSPRCEAVLGPNEVVTVEPGLYRKGVGGVRIEDLVVVSDKNCRILTKTPKDLICPRSPRTI